MVRRFNYTVVGGAAHDNVIGGQTWTVEGVLEATMGDFMDLSERAMRAAFEQLTQGKAVYGKPGVGCRGPYRIILLKIEEAQAQ
jgi:hypothetical protein